MHRMAVPRWVEAVHVLPAAAGAASVIDWSCTSRRKVATRHRQQWVESVYAERGDQSGYALITVNPSRCAA